MTFRVWCLYSYLVHGSVCSVNPAYMVFSSCSIYSAGLLGFVCSSCSVGLLDFVCSLYSVGLMGCFVCSLCSASSVFANILTVFVESVECVWYLF
jgi:hypothetical protein